MAAVEGRVIVDISMSVDGLVTAAKPPTDEPFATGRTHFDAWVRSVTDRRDPRLTHNALTLGALVCGRTTYGTCAAQWGRHGPSGVARRPVIVVTHVPPPADHDHAGVYQFVQGGVVAALNAARSAAGSGDLVVIGGASVIQQFLAAGLVDEIHLQLLPVMVAAGTRLFDHLGRHHIQLERLAVVDAPDATHLRYRVKG